MYLSRVKVLPDRPDKLLEILSADHYSLHQLLWQLFPGQPDAERDFLFRRDSRDHFPVFYLLSQRVPVALPGIMSVETKPYHPQLQVGDKLSFSLVANPVGQFSIERSPEEKQRQLEHRQKNGLKKKVTHKRVRHDVVIHKKKLLLAQGLKKEDLPSTAEIVQETGENWLRQHAEKNGFKIDVVRADGYQQHRFKKRNIQLSTLEFEGVLEVLDPIKFVEQALYQGIGSAKAFGCGLLMIRRV